MPAAASATTRSNRGAPDELRRRLGVREIRYTESPARLATVEHPLA